MSGMLDLRNLAFTARICEDGDPAGIAVSDIVCVNMDRMMWVESNATDRRLSFQLDPGRWLELTFADPAAFSAAYGKSIDTAIGGGS